MAPIIPSTTVDGRLERQPFQHHGNASQHRRTRLPLRTLTQTECETEPAADEPSFEIVEPGILQLLCHPDDWVSGSTAAGTTMIVNPFLQLKLVRNGAGVMRAVTVHAPIKGESLKVTTVDRVQDAEIFTFLLIYLSSDTKRVQMVEAASDRERERLTAIGFLVRDDQVPDPVSYACDFDDIPAYLLPVRAQERPRQSLSVDDLIVDPTLHHLGSDGITPEMRGRKKLASPFRKDRSWFSVEYGLSAPVFYSYTPEASAIADLLTAGDPAPKDLPPAVRGHLVDAGVLRLRSETCARLGSREVQRAAAHKSLVERRYVVLQEIIQPVQLAAIRHYYRDLIDQGFVQFADAEWPNRFFSGLDALAYFFQQQLSGVVGDIAGEKVKPTFSYFASYRPGSGLPAHRDRKQCYYAMSVLLDHDQPNDVSPWPIYVQPPGAPEAAPIYVGLGDGLLYFGEEVLHYRHTLTDGFSTLWFLFWVPETFEGSLD